MKKKEITQANMNYAQTERLLNTEGVCVSVLLNLYQQSNMLKANLTNIEKAIKKATAALERFDAPEDVKRTVLEHLDDVQSEFTNDGTRTAVGFFASANELQLVYFPFEVNECALVQNSFETRDVLYLKQYTDPYYVLNLNKELIQLFSGVADSLTEIKNEHFPAKYTDDYEYEHASPGSSHGYAMKGFEKDKTDIKHIRQQGFVRESADFLAAVLTDTHAKLVVTGPARMISQFEAAYSNTQQILATIGTTFNGRTFETFAPAVWKCVTQSRREEILKIIGQVNDLPLNHKVVGVRDAWGAAIKGKGRLLLVERDLQSVAYQPDGVEEIRLHPPEGKYNVIADAVDGVIEKVIRKHGKVIFTEQNELKKFKGIVLTLRY